MTTNRPASISKQIRQSIRTVSILLVIPLVISLVMMILYAFRYQGIIRQMERTSALMPVVSSEIPQVLFSVAAGRVTYPDSHLDETISDVNNTLKDLERFSTSNGDLQLTVARRTMDTLAGYVHQVRDGMEAHRSVDEITQIVDEVRDVGTLVKDMLSSYIAVGITNAADTNRRLLMLILITTGVELLLLFYAIRRTLYTTNKLTDSIHASILKLQQNVRRLAAGNLRNRVVELNVAQLRGLAEQTNIMADQLERQIEQIRRDQDNLAKSELRTMQAQINPHFLYNTLDTIIWQAQSGKAEQVINLTRSLSDFFRISLSSGADWITVSQELQHITGYLNIQRTRYRDILNYELQIDEQITNYVMVKFLLQPLVENALYHGIKAKRGGGQITIVAQQREHRLYFSVSDNGKGMSQTQLESVLNSLHSDSPSIVSKDSASGGFGLRNVDMRIRLFYHQKQGLSITSGPGGTCVSFDIPCLDRKEDMHD